MQVPLPQPIPEAGTAGRGGPRARILPLLAVLALTAPAALANAPAPLPDCSYGDEVIADTGDDYLLAPVDTRFRLPASFVPGELTPVREAGLADDRQLRAQVVDDLALLVAAAAEDGLEFELQSAYRSYAYQEQVFSGWVETLGEEQALLTSARPGHSEHQLGTVLDLRSAGGPAPWDLDDWAQTPEGSWLAANAWRFGFVMSYPADATGITCYSYEPWHYRWVGRENARAVRDSGLTLREWLWARYSVRSAE